MTGRMPLSHSRIDLYEDCPYLFRATHIEKVPQVKSLPMLFGGFFHHWADQYLQHLITTNQESDYAEANVIFEKLWASRNKHAEFKFLPESARDDMMDVVVKFRETHAFNTQTIAGSEVEISLTEDWKVTEWMAKNVFFRMKIDLLSVERSGGLKIVGIRDFKTSFAIETEEATGRSPQLRRYVMGVQSIMPADEFKVSLDYVRIGVVREATLYPEDADTAKAGVMLVSDRIQQSLQKNDWPATPGRSCAYCSVFERCPARGLAKGFRAPQDIDQAKQTLERLILLEREREDLQTALKLWTKQFGVIASNGMQYGPNVVEIMEYDPRILSGWASKWQIDPMEVLKAAGKADLERRLKKTPDPVAARADLVAIGKNKSFSSFKLKKASEE